MLRLPRVVELILVIVLCGVVAWWLTRMLRGAPIDVPPPATNAAAGADGRVDAVLASARLFGSRRPGVLSDNVRPLGVVADASGRGSVIVSVDGQPPKVYRVGDTLDGRLVSAIRPEEIELDSGGARQVFRLPASRPSPGGLTILGTGTALPAAAGASSPLPTSAAPSAATATPMSPPGAMPSGGPLPPGTPRRPSGYAPVRGPGATSGLPAPPAVGG